jgi:DNA-binding transcriptional regulator YbjK
VTLILTHELYTLAARDASFRDITNAWMARSRRTLQRFSDPTTARILDALVEGQSIHHALDNEPHDEATVATAVERVAMSDSTKAGVLALYCS